MSPSTCRASIRDVADESDDEDDGTGVRLYQSIYETALRHQVPRPVIESLIRIYSYDVDFQRKARPGDSFDVLYTGEEETPGADGKTEVLFASLTVDGEAKKFYRYQTPDDNVVDYYDETGKSAKKFLVRKPLGEGTMRSGFGLRKHPILGYIKMHTGVDWAAPLGTPIYASGNGTVEKVGWESGYGKYVKLRHSNGYETAYGHMTAFAARHRGRFARTPGPDHRLRRLDRPVDRPASALRDPGQRPLRRPDAHPAAARPRARRPDARVVSRKSATGSITWAHAARPRAARRRRRADVPAELVEHDLFRETGSSTFADDHALFRDDGVSQFDRRRNLAQTLEALPCPLDLNGAVVEQASQDRLNDVDRLRPCPCSSRRYAGG